jgi:hypothetical protein
MKVDYYLEEEMKENLYCRISDDTEQVTFSMGYAVKPENWDSDDEELDLDDVHWGTLRQFKKFLVEKYEELKKEGKDELLVLLKKEAQILIKESGIMGIATNLFDYFNKGNKIPEYKDYVQAFEKFSNLKKDEFKPIIIDNKIRFQTKDGKEFDADTYEGLSVRLKSIVEKRLHTELLIESNSHIWSEIYVDGGIEKHKFLPEMLNEWKIYWNREYQQVKKEIEMIKEIEEAKESGLLKETVKFPRTQEEILEKLELEKKDSWKSFQVFMACYDDVADVIQLAVELDEECLFPIAVITMLHIFDAETCYSEYCDFEFCEEYDWESVLLDEEDDESPLFFFKECEMYD